MADRGLRKWVADELHGILGFSETHTVEYIVSLARTTKSPAALLGKLAEADVPSNERTRRFAAELFSKAPQSSSASAASKSGSDARQQHREAASLVRQNDRYAMVSDGDDDGEDEVQAAVQKALQEKEKERQRAQRKRARAEEATERERTSHTAGAGAGGADGGGGGGGGSSSADALRDQDLRERDEFAERLRQRDLERTKKLSGPEADALAARHGEAERLMGAGSAEEKAAALEEARKISRRRYLEMREKKQLEAARDDIADEEFLFEGVELTEREKKDLEYKKKVYELANERVNITDHVDQYARTVHRLRVPRLRVPRLHVPRLHVSRLRELRRHMPIVRVPRLRAHHLRVPRLRVPGGAAM